MRGLKKTIDIGKYVRSQVSYFYLFTWSCRVIKYSTPLLPGAILSSLKIEWLCESTLQIVVFQKLIFAFRHMPHPKAYSTPVGG